MSRGNAIVRANTARRVAVAPFGDVVRHASPSAPPHGRVALRADVFYAPHHSAAELPAFVTVYFADYFVHESVVVRVALRALAPDDRARVPPTLRDAARVYVADAVTLDGVSRYAQLPRNAIVGLDVYARGTSNSFEGQPTNQPMGNAHLYLDALAEGRGDLGSRVFATHLVEEHDTAEHTACATAHVGYEKGRIALAVRSLRVAPAFEPRAALEPLEFHDDNLPAIERATRRLAARAMALFAGGGALVPRREILKHIHLPRFVGARVQLPGFAYPASMPAAPIGVDALAAFVAIVLNRRKTSGAALAAVVEAQYAQPAAAGVYDARFDDACDVLAEVLMLYADAFNYDDDYVDRDGEREIIERMERVTNRLSSDCEDGGYAASVVAWSLEVHARTAGAIDAARHPALAALARIYRTLYVYLFMTDAVSRASANAANDAEGGYAGHVHGLLVSEHRVRAMLARGDGAAAAARALPPYDGPWFASRVRTLVVEGTGPVDPVIAPLGSLVPDGNVVTLAAIAHDIEIRGAIVGDLQSRPRSAGEAGELARAYHQIAQTALDDGDAISDFYKYGVSGFTITLEQRYGWGAIELLFYNAQTRVYGVEYAELGRNEPALALMPTCTYSADELAWARQAVAQSEPPAMPVTAYTTPAAAAALMARDAGLALMARADADALMRAMARRIGPPPFAAGKLDASRYMYTMAYAVHAANVDAGFVRDFERMVTETRVAHPLAGLLVDTERVAVGLTNYTLWLSFYRDAEHKREYTAAFSAFSAAAATVPATMGASTGAPVASADDGQQRIVMAAAAAAPMAAMGARAEPTGAALAALLRAPRREQAAAMLTQTAHHVLTLAYGHAELRWLADATADMGFWERKFIADYVSAVPWARSVLAYDAIVQRMRDTHTGDWLGVYFDVGQQPDGRAAAAYRLARGRARAAVVERADDATRSVTLDFDRLDYAGSPFVHARQVYYPYAELADVLADFAARDYAITLRASAHAMVDLHGVAELARTAIDTLHWRVDGGAAAAGSPITGVAAHHVLGRQLRVTRALHLALPNAAHRLPAFGDATALALHVALPSATATAATVALVTRSYARARLASVVWRLAVVRGSRSLQAEQGALLAAAALAYLGAGLPCVIGVHAAADAPTAPDTVLAHDYMHAHESEARTDATADAYATVTVVLGPRIVLDDSLMWRDALRGGGIGGGATLIVTNVTAQQRAVAHAAAADGHMRTLDIDAAPTAAAGAGTEAELAGGGGLLALLPAGATDRQLAAHQAHAHAAALAGYHARLGRAVGELIHSMAHVDVDACDAARVALDRDAIDEALASVATICARLAADATAVRAQLGEARDGVRDAPIDADEARRHVRLTLAELCARAEIANVHAASYDAGDIAPSMLATLAAVTRAIAAAARAAIAESDTDATAAAPPAALVDSMRVYKRVARAMHREAHARVPASFLAHALHAALVALDAVTAAYAVLADVASRDTSSVVARLRAVYAAATAPDAAATAPDATAPYAAATAPYAA